MTRRLARTLMLCWTALPAGAIGSIVTGDLRYLGVGLVLFVAAWGYGLLTLEAARQSAKAKAAAAAQDGAQ